MKTPESPSEITAEWLNDTLLPNASDRQIISIELDKNFGPWSLLGKVVRVRLKYNTEEREPKSVIVKFQVNCSDPKNEGIIYQLLSESDTPFIPRIYGNFGNGNLVMEDLSSTHSVIKTDLSIEQARNVVAMLADFNGRYFNDHRFPENDISHFVNSININFGQSWEIFKNRYQERLGKEAAAFEWVWNSANTVSRQYNSGPATLNHGDVNKSNLLFPNTGNESPILIDWQLAGQKIIPFDLSYFLLKTLTVEQRRKYEDTLLKEYYESLPESIRSEYEFSRFLLDYRACATRSMLSAVMAVGPKFNSQPNQFERADALADRIIAAVQELRPIEAIQELDGRGLLK